MVMFERYENQGQMIFYGDSLQILSSEITSESVDLIFIDPPYNIGKKFSNFHDKWESDEEYAVWVYQLLDECIRILKPNGTLYMMASTQAMPYFDLYLRNKIVIQGGLVLDPFGGTFTSAAVAKRLGRNSISIESQEEYVKIGLRRVLGWQEYQG